MKSLRPRLLALALVAGVLLPLLAGCTNRGAAPQSPDGLSNRQRREQKQGAGNGQ